MNGDGESDGQPLSSRGMALLRAVQDGRAEISRSCEPDLFIDGLYCCDQFTAHQLARAGLVRPAEAGALGERVPAELTRTGRQAVATAPLTAAVG